MSYANENTSKSWIAITVLHNARNGFVPKSVTAENPQNVTDPIKTIFAPKVMNFWVPLNRTISSCNCLSALHDEWILRIEIFLWGWIFLEVENNGITPLYNGRP